MSRTRMSSSWSTSKRTSRWRAGSGSWSPEQSSAYISATRSGVRSRPSRVGSSPIASSSSVTARTTRSWSTPAGGGAGAARPGQARSASARRGHGHGATARRPARGRDGVRRQEAPGPGPGPTGSRAGSASGGARRRGRARPRPRPPRRSAAAPPPRLRRSPRPARSSTVDRIAIAESASSSSGRLRCSRTPRSTCPRPRMPTRRQHVDQQRDLDPPPLDHRHRLEQLPPPGVLAGQRLGEPGQLGEEPAEQRAGDELAHPSPTGRLAVERASVVALHELQPGVGEQRVRSGR